MAEYKFATDYGKDLLVDLNQLAHTSGTDCTQRDVMQRAFKEITRLRDDRWKHGAESMRHAILQQLPGGQTCDPQWVADMIRAIALPSQDQQSAGGGK